MVIFFLVFNKLTTVSLFSNDVPPDISMSFYHSGSSITVNLSDIISLKAKIGMT